MAVLVLACSSLSAAALGLLAGIHVFGSAALNPTLRSLEAGTYLCVKQAADQRFPVLMKPLMLGSLVVAAAATVAAALAGEALVVAASVTALAAGAVALVAVLRGDLPINATMAGWDPQRPPQGWQQVRSRWEAWFTVRTWASGIAFAAALAAVLAARA